MSAKIFETVVKHGVLLCAKCCIGEVFFVQSYKSEKKRDFLLQKVSESDIIVSVEGKAIRKTSGLPTVVYRG